MTQEQDRKELRKLPENVKAVIFDLDGTLVDSMWLWHEIDIEYLGRFGLSLPEDLQKCIEGMSIHETAVYMKTRFSIPDSLDQMIDDWNRMAWDKYENEVPLKTGVETFIKNCKKNRIKLGIASSNSRKLVENVLNVHGIRDSFESIKTGSEVTNGKPAPDIYLAVADELGVEVSECIVFEDIVPGLLAGKSAGMLVCAVEDLYSRYAKEEKIRLADYFIENYEGILF